MSDSSFGNQTGGSKEVPSSDAQSNERWEFDRDYLEWDDEKDDPTPRSEALLCLHGIRDHFIDSNLDGTRTWFVLSVWTDSST